MRKYLLSGLLVCLIPLAALGQTRGFQVESKTESAPALGGVNRALLIGNNDYQSKRWPPLKTAVKDVDELGKVLQDRYGFAEKNMVLLKNATRRDMLLGFNKIKAQSGPEDRVLIYYGGHGEYDKDQRGWWIPVDAKDNIDYISNADILGRVAAIKAKHKLLISDSCFSGTLLTRSARDTSRKASTPAFVKSMSSRASVQGFTSGGTEPVSDGGPKWDGHSIFAFHLIAQLNANTQRYLAAGQLAGEVTKWVANNSASIFGSDQMQTPIFSAITGQPHQGGEFFFTPTDVRKVTDFPLVSVFFLRGQSGEFESHAKLARHRVFEALGKSMTKVELRSVPEMDFLNPEEIGEQLRAKLAAQNSELALVVELNGGITPQRTLMWKGLAALEMKLQAFKFHQDKLVDLGVHDFKKQKLPLRRLAASAEDKELQFDKAAEKLSKKWSRQDMHLLLSRLTF